MDRMQYGLGAIADAALSTAQAASQLEDIRNQAQQLLAQSQEFFVTSQGSDAYHDAQNRINQAISHGEDVIKQHGTVTQSIGDNFHSTDGAAANSWT